MGNNDLRISDLPGENASVAELRTFAGDFDGYGAAGGFHECAKIAQDPDWDSITELRIAMFFSLRAMRHCGDDFGSRDEEKFRDHVSRIRALLQDEETSG